VKTIEVACPSCGAQPGGKCHTPVNGVDTGWDHDTRILRAMFTDEDRRQAEYERYAYGQPGIQL